MSQPTMRAIVISRFGAPSVLTITDLPRPEPRPGDVLIKVAAFGVNHAEMHMRRGEWAEWMPVSGIECVGTVAACPGGEFTPGTLVATLMGGLGRTINGSYAEYTCARAANVVALADPSSTTTTSSEDDVVAKLSWAQLAAIPESYATAWTCLFRNLELRAGQRLLVRGGTSAFGRAAINLAVEAGARVVATTRSEARAAQLRELGVEGVEIEVGNLSEGIVPDDETEPGKGKFDAVLDLVGNSTLLDSLQLVRRGGRVCLAGFLGGLAPMPDFNPLLQMASGVHFSFFGSFVFGKPEFPLSDVPLRDIVRMVAEGKFAAKPSRVFKFEEIQEAHRVMEANESNGKMVVVIE